jgi:hypothetical protein
MENWFYALLPFALVLCVCALGLLLITRRSSFDLSIKGLGVTIELSAPMESRKEEENE